MDIQQADPGHKRGINNPQPASPQLIPKPDPQFVRFGSVQIIGQAHPFGEIGGDDPALNGWGGVLAAVADFDMIAFRSADGLTVYLLPMLTEAKRESRA